ncbi:MAG: hypothetical protein V5A43_07275 [Haloarculaceae archaeon]
MASGPVPLAALVCCLVLAGCLGAADPGAGGSTTALSPDDRPGTDGSTPAANARTDRLPPSENPSPVSATPADGGMPAEPARLPATADCLADQVPSPSVTAGANDSLTGRAYPDSPDPTSIEAVEDWTIAFEEARFYNRVLREEDPEEETLARVTGQVTRANATRIQGGYLVRVEGLGATTFESGIHGDYGITALYRFTPDAIERSDRIEPGERNFSPVVAC